MKNNNKGFTLIEVIVIIAIIAILATVLFSSLSLIFSTENRESAYKISELIEQTRSYAMNGRPSATLTIKLDGDKYYGEITVQDTDQADGTVITVADDVEIGDDDMNLKIDSAEVTTAGTEITFNSDGSLKDPTTGGDDFVTLTDYKVSIVKSTGLVEVHKN